MYMYIYMRIYIYIYIYITSNEAAPGAAGRRCLLLGQRRDGPAGLPLAGGAICDSNM